VSAITRLTDRITAPTPDGTEFINSTGMCRPNADLLDVIQMWHETARIRAVLTARTTASLTIIVVAPTKDAPEMGNYTRIIATTRNCCRTKHGIRDWIEAINDTAIKE
jgi:P2-related tail formation protein